MDAKELLQYVQKRRGFIEKNSTNDVFCASCLQATIDKGGKSECCGRDILSKEQALERIPIIINKLKERIW